MGNLQHDGAGINVGTKSQFGTEVAYNWVHDSNRQGVRFDYHGTHQLRPDGEVMEMVCTTTTLLGTPKPIR